MSSTVQRPAAGGDADLVAGTPVAGTRSVRYAPRDGALKLVDFEEPRLRDERETADAEGALA
jgi:hypothetical protein